MESPKKLQVLQLSPRFDNFQTGYIADSILLESNGKQASSEVKYVAVPLSSQNRRILLRRSLRASPEDVTGVIRCDFRVQQLMDQSNDFLGNVGMQKQIQVSSDPHYPSEKSTSEEVWNIREETSTERKTCASPEDYYEDRVSHENREKRALLPTETVGVVVGGSIRNDYSEIDLARHIVEIECEGKGGIGTLARMGKAVEKSEEEKSLSFQQLPSAVRFNDALVCTSKDLKILKSGAIKMMRLTVICHSDLHYQNCRKSRHQNQNQSHSTESCFRNEATAKDTVPFAKLSSITSTVYSSSSVQVTAENREWEKKTSGTSIETQHHQLGEKKSEGILAFNVSSATSSSHQHSHHDELHRSSLSVESKLLKLSLNSPSATEAEAAKRSKKWKRLKEKIRNVFQTYEIYAAEHTLVDLKSCPLATFHSNFSPSIRFVFVEECEMRNNSRQADRDTIGRVTGKTEIIISNVHHISYYERLLEKNSRSGLHLYGLEDAAKILSSVIEMQVEEKRRESHPVSCSPLISLTEFSHGLLISGPSGCGKTVVVRETAKKAGAHLLSFNPDGSLENASHFCQQLSEIFMSAMVTASRYPTVLLFTRIHLLFQASHAPSSTKSSRSSRERVLHHLCKLFDSIPPGLTLSVVGTTDKAFLVPLQLRRAGRLEKEIVIGPPKESERLKILQELSWDIPQFSNVDLNFIASQTPGYVPQDLEKLIRLSLFKCQEEDCCEVSEQHVKYSIGRVIPSVLEGALGVVDIQRTISLDDIAGLHSVKLDLIKAIVWPLKHPHSFLRMGISPPKGILLYGPPGNCKTSLVRAVAASHHTNFLSVSAAELFSSAVGDSEKIVAHLFHRARMASPCILFIDELESIVRSRQNSEKNQTQTNESILSMLLTEMDGVGVSKIQDSKIFSSTSAKDQVINKHETPSLGPIVLVVAATNRPDLIDPALLRPGRFDKLIGVPPLNEIGRQELFKICSKSIPFHSDVDFGDLAKATEHYSGADLVNLCREAAMYALSEDMSAPFVTNKHVSLAKCVVGPSLNPAMVRAFHEYGTGVRSC